MNSRIGTPSHHKFKYKVNPDNVINTNGRKLLSIISRFEKTFVVNGVIHDEISCDSNFTYYRGNLSSQNDSGIANSIESIERFSILPKVPQSDHCPCALSVTIKINPSLKIINDCACGILNYEHYDVNRRIKRPIKLHSQYYKPL